MTYLITFACYGCRLHGDESGSIDRKHNLPGRRLVAADLKRVSAERGQMDQPPYSMDRKRRKAVLEALLDSCSYRNWNVLAAHVRSSHAHIVVESEAPPERIMNDLKSYARRHLNRMGLDQAARKRWARHGSTRWSWKAEHVSAAVRYVLTSRVSECRYLRRVIGKSAHVLPRWNEKAGSRRDAVSSQWIRTRGAKETGHEEE